MTEIMAEVIVNTVMRDWQGRGGFDAFWEEIDDETRDEIIKTHIKKVQKILDQNG